MKYKWKVNENSFPLKYYLQQINSKNGKDQKGPERMKTATVKVVNDKLRAYAGAKDQRIYRETLFHLHIAYSR